MNVTEFRTIVEAWVRAAAGNSVPVQWAFAPRSMQTKSPWRVELEGPVGLAVAGGGEDELRYEPVVGSGDEVTEVPYMPREGDVIIRVHSRVFSQPAEELLMQLRWGLMRQDVVAILRAGPIAVHSVSPTVRVPTLVDQREESVAAMTALMSFVWTPAGPLDFPTADTIGSVDITGDVDPLEELPTLTVSES